MDFTLLFSGKNNHIWLSRIMLLCLSRPHFLKENGGGVVMSNFIVSTFEQKTVVGQWHLVVCLWRAFRSRGSTSWFLSWGPFVSLFHRFPSCCLKTLCCVQMEGPLFIFLGFAYWAVKWGWECSEALCLKALPKAVQQCNRDASQEVMQPLFHTKPARSHAHVDSTLKQN